MSSKSPDREDRVRIVYIDNDGEQQVIGTRYLGDLPLLIRLTIGKSLVVDGIIIGETGNEIVAIGLKNQELDLIYDLIPSSSTDLFVELSRLANDIDTTKYELPNSNQENSYEVH
jgi:hypothetical protein